jgi:hypothetical protein
MICVVPLAGPDVVHERLGIKALMDIGGRPLVETALTSRPWWRDGLLSAEGLIFVLRRDIDASNQIEEVLRGRFPGARFAWLSGLSGGAIYSALAATALVADASAPLCVDLVDILYESDAPLADRFVVDPELAGLVPWFPSSEACYSYVRMDATGRVWEAVEKRVISTHASAGTYLFRDTATWLDAAAWSVRHRDEVAVKNTLFVCPSFMGLIVGGRKVLGCEVRNAKPISKIFHPQDA